jgi:hypothetical protein
VDSEDEENAAAAHEARIRRCSSCNAKIIWFKTEAGRWTPVNADTVEAGDEEFDPPRHVTHFATCPNANNHRKGKSKT